MSKTKWTPGPWEPRSDGDRQYVGCGVFCIVDEVYATVETADRGAKERKSNAQLIAAAPDLYESIEDLLKYGWWENAPASADKARAALAKARGEA